MGTTLLGDISSSATTITLASFERLPTANYFSIDSENIICATITGNVGSSCTRGAAGSTAAAHSNGAAVFGRAVGNGSTSDLLSWFNLASPSMFTVVLDSTNTRILENGTEPIYNGFYSVSSLPFTIGNNTRTDCGSLAGMPASFSPARFTTF